MLPHPLTNFEIQKYCQYEPRFNGDFSRNNLSLKIKNKKESKILTITKKVSNLLNNF